MSLGLVLLTPLLCPGCSSQTRYGEAIRHARAIIERYREATGPPALQIAVGVDGRIVWSQAFGSAELSPRRPATTRSRFRIASISKLLTGTLTAKLAREGVLDPDRAIGSFVPDLPASWHDITARMLVHHTSGIGHYQNDRDALDTTYYPTTRSALRRFQDRPLLFPPGTDEQYSSYAYTVLALAIERAAGRPFLDEMREEILEPLGMTETGPDLQSSPSPDRAAFYDLAGDDSVRKSPYIDLSGRWAGSGYLSTAEDLVRFGMAHASGGALSPETRALVARRDTLPDGSLTKEGFGWGPRSDWDGRGMLWGDGSTPGSRCGLLVYPRDGVAIAILTNLRGLALERGEFQTLARLFLAARRGEPLLPPPAGARGAWSGTVRLGADSIDVRLAIGPGGRGTLSFPGWQSLEIADMFRLKDTTWVVALDRHGIFPITFTLSGDRMAATAPRAGWSFLLTRSPRASGRVPGGS